MMLRLYLAALALTALIVGGLWTFTGGTSERGIAALLGCALAALNGLAAVLVNARAVGRDMSSFMIWVGAGHGLRALLLFLAVGGALLYRVPHARLFTAAALIGYMCFMVVEIVLLQRGLKSAAGAQRGDVK